MLDLDRLTGSVIDAYTLAPNDEDAKREAVKAAIQHGLRHDASETTGPCDYPTCSARGAGHLLACRCLHVDRAH